MSYYDILFDKHFVQFQMKSLNESKMILKQFTTNIINNLLYDVCKACESNVNHIHKLPAYYDIKEDIKCYCRKCKKNKLTHNYSNVIGNKLIKYFKKSSKSSKNTIKKMAMNIISDLFCEIPSLHNDYFLCNKCCDIISPYKLLHSLNKKYNYLCNESGECNKFKCKNCMKNYCENCINGEICIDCSKFNKYTYGVSKIVDLMNNYRSKYGDRFTPTQLLVDMAKENKKFYS